MRRTWSVRYCKAIGRRDEFTVLADGWGFPLAYIVQQNWAWLSHEWTHRELNITWLAVVWKGNDPRQCSLCVWCVWLTSISSFGGVYQWRMAFLWTMFVPRHNITKSIACNTFNICYRLPKIFFGLLTFRCVKKKYWGLWRLKLLFYWKKM